MKNKDELYKLSQSRLQKLLNQYQEIQEESLILEKDFRRVPLNKLHELLPPTSKWSVFYELEYPRHLMFVLRWIGVLDGYLEAARSDNPLDNVLTYIDTIDKKAVCHRAHGEHRDREYLVFSAFLHPSLSKTIPPCITPLCVLCALVANIVFSNGFYLK